MATQLKNAANHRDHQTGGHGLGTLGSHCFLPGAGSERNADSDKPRDIFTLDTRHHFDTDTPLESSQHQRHKSQRLLRLGDLVAVSGNQSLTREAPASVPTAGNSATKDDLNIKTNPVATANSARETVIVTKQSSVSTTNTARDSTISTTDSSIIKDNTVTKDNTLTKDNTVTRGSTITKDKTITKGPTLTKEDTVTTKAKGNTPSATSKGVTAITNKPKTTSPPRSVPNISKFTSKRNKLFNSTTTRRPSVNGAKPANATARTSTQKPKAPTITSYHNEGSSLEMMPSTCDIMGSSPAPDAGGELELSESKGGQLRSSGGIIMGGMLGVGWWLLLM
ncbi:hypothetical protein QBC44DRAFT_371475 [Cladorrhinum sp. PSN332]|nr:hypothetical protein QBC44DRAFT_371475 [Cladorrhinum sp. PSN332]